MLYICTYDNSGRQRIKEGQTKRNTPAPLNPQHQFVYCFLAHDAACWALPWPPIKS